MNVKLLESLSNASGVAGNEGEIRKILKEELKGYADEVLTDGLGSLIFHKKGNGPKIMLAAHMDEVGFLVRAISDYGMLTVMPLGGVKMTARTNQEVIITTEDYKKYYGYLQSDIKEDGTAANTYIDLGVDSKADVEALGIQPGDMAVFNSTFKSYTMHRYTGKALDDRTGVVTLVECLKHAHTDCDCWYCFTSSEEVGTRGGKTCAELIHPDAAVIVDVACWHSELVRNHENNRQLGKGPMLVLYDKTVIANKAFVSLARKSAEHVHVHLQDDMFSGGGTDAGNIGLSNGGTPTVTFGIPLRYCHTSYSICDERDIDDCSKVISDLLENMNTEVLKKLRFQDEL